MINRTMTRNIVLIGIAAAGVYVFRDTISEVLPGDIFGTAASDTTSTAMGSGTYGTHGAYIV